MKSLCAWTVAAMAACSAEINATVIEEDFSTDPLLRGWEVHGASEVFQWDQPGGSLQVTWDSSGTNSYFYKPLGTVLTKADEFNLAFDLRLDEVTLGSFELAIGLIHFADATRPGFLRGTGADSPNLAEFDYFPEWSSIDATTSDSAGAMQFRYEFPVTLEMGTTYRVVLKHAAGDGMLTGEVYLNRALYATMSKSYPNTNFTDFRVDTLAVCNYNGAGSFADLRARGQVDNVVLDLPLLVGTIFGEFAAARWKVKVSSSTDCTYSLQRTTDLKEWSDVGSSLPGTGGQIFLEDSQPLPASAFYRVRVTR